MESVKRECRGIQKQLVAWRRLFHQYPELGLELPKTADCLAEELRKMGLEVKTGVGGHGLTAVIEGKMPGKTLGIRADMDALPIQEKTGLPFASKIKGIMHACGHDSHMAYFLNEVPETFFHLPSCNARKGQTWPHHHPKFDIDEGLLWLGSALFVATAMEWQ